MVSKALAKPAPDNSDDDQFATLASKASISSAKRSPSPATPSTTPTKKARKTPTSSPKPAPVGAKDIDISSSTDWSQVEGWTAEKREAVVALCFVKGAAGIGMAALGNQSMANALAPNRPGNLRDKVIKAMKV